MEKIQSKNQMHTQCYLTPALSSLLDSTVYNWIGVENQWGIHYSKPIPVISKTSAIYAQLVEAKVKLEEVMQPATSQEIINLLTRLSLHYPINGLEKSQFQTLIADFIEDLSPYPTDLIRDACRAYRRNG